MWVVDEMNQLTWRIVRHADLSIVEKFRILQLKNQHWPYGINSQICWMKDNICNNDYHLMGEEYTEHGIKIKAYLTIVFLKVEIDGRNFNALGLGGVCIDKSIEHKGYGKRIVEEANEFIKGNGMKGFLLCKNHLVEFYRKCHWKLLNFEYAEIANVLYENSIMELDDMCSCSKIIINRNF
jgi:predicted GNAT family N-acyltransferase